MELSEQQKRDFVALLIREYNIQVSTDNELLPVFYLSHQSAAIAQKSINESCKSLESYLLDFKMHTDKSLEKLQTKQFFFNDPKTAFWFAFGFISPLLVAVVIICATTLIIIKLF